MNLVLNPEFMAKLHHEQVKLRVADQLRALREEQGWSQRATAKRAGIAWRDVWRIENCYWKHITIKTMVQLANAFDVAIDFRFHPSR